RDQPGLVALHRLPLRAPLRSVAPPPLGPPPPRPPPPRPPPPPRRPGSGPPPRARGRGRPLEGPPERPRPRPRAGGRAAARFDERVLGGPIEVDLLRALHGDLHRARVLPAIRPLEGERAVDDRPHHVRHGRVHVTERPRRRGRGGDHHLGALFALVDMLAAQH